MNQPGEYDDPEWPSQYRGGAYRYAPQYLPRDEILPDHFSWLNVLAGQRKDDHE
jgi:hypothetical protein